MPPFLIFPGPRAARVLSCESVPSPVSHLHEGPPPNHHADVSEPTCSGSKAQHPNQAKPVAASGRWRLRRAQHHAEMRRSISVSFIANIARKRPELNRDKNYLFQLFHQNDLGSKVARYPFRSPNDKLQSELVLLRLSLAVLTYNDLVRPGNGLRNGNLWANPVDRVDRQE